MSVQSQIDRIEQNLANTYAVLSSLGADMPSEKNSDNLASTAGTAKAVLYSQQSLTEAQKAQARRNIGAQAELTEADKEEIVQQVISALGTPVFGTVDADNNIILTGNLAEGTYTLKYEDAEGNVTEIGMLNHTVVPDPAYINQIAVSTDTDGSIYNGKGWIEHKRLNSSGAVADVGDYGYTGVTGFIPITNGDTIRTSAGLVNAAGSSQQSVCFYDADKAFIRRDQYYNSTDRFGYDKFIVKADRSLEYTHDNTYMDLSPQAAYIRFCFAGIDANAIITRNEEIL